MSKISALSCLFLMLALTLLTGCGGGSGPDQAVAPLSQANVNLIFVVSSDLTYHGQGDVDPVTARKEVPDTFSELTC